MTYIAFDGVFKAIQIRDQVVDTKPLETRIVRLAQRKRNALKIMRDEEEVDLT